MGWNGHFVKCTNRATRNDSGRRMQWGLRKRSSRACNDNVSGKEEILEMREDIFLPVYLGRLRLKVEQDMPGSRSMEGAGAELGVLGQKLRTLSSAHKASVGKTQQWTQCMCALTP